ncbi:MAG: preprotein translocase subunit SecG [Candidatus Margulisbacteria bacterium]|nr:preprotein translocase subunit SecG [Candidatus Margulisiibacteriota bacterium]MBU1617006.1 preprotein translocase subunit SecG [Candidatus Margulisiibacteriota bacterium]MBU1867002.1 preprotein translocase subunit SecG [Candidatus Margulisiibacteriota bacterium]
MTGLLVFLQIASGILLVIAVLLHTAKGEGLGGIGGTAHIFGTPKGMEEGLDRLTWGLAGAFMLFSIFLAMLKG